MSEILGKTENWNMACLYNSITSFLQFSPCQLPYHGLGEPLLFVTFSMSALLQSK